MDDRNYQCQFIIAAFFIDINAIFYHCKHIKKLGLNFTSNGF